MPSIEATTFVTAPSTVRAKLGALVSRIWALHIQRRARYHARRELYALDDRMLRDIGVSRGEIEFIVCEQKTANPGASPTQRWTSQSAMRRRA
jgi:uncharacterized protein YjiS (DUF1127 family)